MAWPAQSYHLSRASGESWENVTASEITPDPAWGRETAARGRASPTNSDNGDKQAPTHG